MRAAIVALIFVYTVGINVDQDLNSNIISLGATCHWCQKAVDARLISVMGHLLCHPCYISALNALQLAKQVTQLIPKGGRQLYIAVEKTGKERELLSVKRWSPLGEPLVVDNAEQTLVTYPLPQE